MTPVQKILAKMARLWMLEHCARGTLLISALTANGVLLCLLLHRAIGAPLVSVVGVVLLAVVAIVALVVRARIARPSAATLAQLLDERAHSRDLFASALEFDQSSGHHGMLGELTCDLAQSQAAIVALRPRWSLGSTRQWAALISIALLLIASYASTKFLGSFRHAAGAVQVAIAPPARKIDVPARSTVEEQKPVAPPAVATADTAKEPAADPKPEPTVPITNEMIDKYLAQMPASQDIDLTGVTPIRWDANEANGKNNPQNQPPADKIDPVKLDSALLKDLQDAKKKEDKEGGKTGGVDIAVMGDKPGSKVKGKEGGKENGESLANAVSKDPRGDPTRMAIKPTKQGLQIRSVARTASTQKGDERPMNVLDFVAALENAKIAQAAEKTSDAAVDATRSEDRVTRQESVSDDAGALTDAYFAQLRKADR